MFTLITLVLLALLAGGAYIVKRVLNKKREAISHVRKAYTPEVLRAFEKCYTADLCDEESYKDWHRRVKKLLCPKPIKRKKIAKSKHTKRFV